MKKFIKYIVLLVLLVGSTLEIRAQQQNFLSVSGNKLYDTTGKEVRLTGVNWFGFETQNYSPHGVWSRDMKSVLQQIKDLGFNTIRVPWANEMLNPSSTIAINSYGTDPYTGISPMNEEETTVSKPIELMDIFVRWCQENDMKIVLDNHSRAADGFLNEAVWYTPEYSEERWIKDWVFMADRYKDFSAVVAMDLNNEPHGSTWGNSDPATDWNKAAERCGNAVLAANPNVLIIVEGVGEFEGNSYWWGGQLMGARKYPVQLSDPSKLMYSAHEYGPEVAAQDWFDAPDFPQNMPQIWEDNYHYLYKEGTSPILLGEFGIKNQDAFGGIAYTWFTEFTDFMGGIYSWTFWSMNPNSGDTGGILQDDWTNVNQWKLDVLTPHMAPIIPNVVGGTPPPPPIVDGGVIAGGPFVFTVGDGIADNVSGITITGTIGETNQWIVTDNQRNILGLPLTPEAVDFDGAGTGTCFIYNVTYNGTITGLTTNANLSGLSGDFDLSNRIEVIRNPVDSNPTVDGGVISGGPFEFTVGDGIADNVSGITITGTVGDTSQWVVTDDQRNILGLPPTPEAVDFDGAGTGTCFIYNVTYNGTITGLTTNANLSGLSGDFDLSNRIEVVRNPFIGGGGGDCGFGAPLANPLPTIANASYENIYVLGTGGPDLSNVTIFTINWDLQNNGLWQLSMNTNNGVPSWWNNLLTNITSQSFNSAQPSITLSGTGIAKLDGAYSATMDGNNFALVSKSGAFTIYFSTSTTAPNCESSLRAPVLDDIAAIKAYPNPVDDKLIVQSKDLMNGAIIDLVDVTGRVVQTTTVKSKVREVEISTSDLTIGLYFIKFYNNKKTTTQQIIKR